MNTSIGNLMSNYSGGEKISISRWLAFYLSIKYLERIKNTTIYIEVGLLTSREIASMDLSNTKLAVLSACQTGGYPDAVGRIKGLGWALKSRCLVNDSLVVEYPK